MFFGRNGVTFFSVIRSRTPSWTPRGPLDNPRGDLMVSATDVAHFFFSALLDIDGPVWRNDNLPDGLGRAVWKAFTATLFEEDFGEIARRIVDSAGSKDDDTNFDPFSSWMWDLFVQCLKKVENPTEKRSILRRCAGTLVRGGDGLRGDVEWCGPYDSPL